MSIESSLQAFGIAQVLVTLKAVPVGASAGLSAIAGSDLKHVTRHFSRSQDSPEGAIALEMAPATPRTEARGRSHQGATAMAAAPRASKPQAYRIYENLGLILGTVDAVGYKELKKSKEVKDVDSALDLSLIKPIAATEVKGKAGVTWGIKRLGVPELWDMGFTGAGVLVGHLDTGVDGKHPALKEAIAQFAEMDSQGDQIPNAKARDSATHGTHTAGTIAGRTVNGMRFGVAPGALLASAMVIEDPIVIRRILAGMDWVIGQGARILSMSLGLRGFNPAFIALMQALRNRGVLPVIASGNEGPATSRSPGNYENVLSVGMFGENELVAERSSSQRINRKSDPLVPDLVGPGVGILSSLPGKKFGMLDGTSMATPHIAGLAALLLEAVPTASVDDLEAAILGSCKLPKTMPKTRANRGVPNGPAALKLLQASSSAAGTTAKLK
jgi:subtilisin